jgi:hypothetical protein
MSVLDEQVGGNHYQRFKIQPLEFFKANEKVLGWCEMNAIKYICRHDVKNGREDIEKAIHYLGLILERDYPEPKKANWLDIDDQIHKETDIFEYPQEDILDGCNCPICTATRNTYDSIRY